MCPDEPPDDDMPGQGPPIPPEDRLWRHPSELGRYGTELPDRRTGRERRASPFGPASFVDPASSGPGRSRVGLALIVAASCLAGAVLALAGSAAFRSDDETDPADAGGRRAPTTISLDRTTGTEELADDMADVVARLDVRQGSKWATGAASVLDDGGTLVTTATLATGASEILVTFAGRSTHKAKVAGVDKETGVAVLRVDKGADATVRLDTDRPPVGESVALIGAPEHDAHVASVSLGVVRAVGHRVETPAGVMHDMIQIDREVPDADAGALVTDATGRVVGMAVAGDPDDGMGDVVPADVLQRVGSALAEDGEVDRAWLGVQAVDLDPDRAHAMGVTGAALLTEVSDPSPAATAGLAAGDIVLRIGHDTIGSASEVVVALRTFAPHDGVDIVVSRSGERRTLHATLGQG